MSLLIATLIAVGLADGQEHTNCPMHPDSSKPTEAVAQRHEEATGIANHGTSHHFVLTKDGGQIELNGSPEAREGIRSHLQAIARAFAAGDFSIPSRIHDRTPPGVDTMKELKGAISYRFEKSEDGGIVRIATADPAALQAVHEFLRFQIGDHGTGDPLEPR